MADQEEDPLKGLTSEEADARLQQYGRNEIPEQKVPWYALLLRQFVGPFPCMIEAACVLAGVAQKFEDFGIILAMLLVNATVGFYQEAKTQYRASLLKHRVVSTYSVKRDGGFRSLEGPLLVPEDVVFLKGGQIVPADCRYLEGSVLRVDTAILTGEPFPRKVPDYDMEEDEGEEKEEPGDSGQCREDTKDASTDAARPRHHTRQGRKQQQQQQQQKKNKKKKIERRVLWAGCIVKTGEAYCRVQATGLRTEVGKAAKSIQANSAVRRRSLFEDKILVVANAIIGITLAVVVAILVLQIHGRRQEWKVAVVRALSLTIASVPVALPLVMNVMMAAGAHEMARQKALVTHLSALQEIASMDVLCSDKTGTLTTAQITVFADRIQAFPASHAAADACPAAEVLAYAALASNPHNKDDPIDAAVLTAYHRQQASSLPPVRQQQQLLQQVNNAGDIDMRFQIVRFHPFNSTIKRTTVHVLDRTTGHRLVVSKGAVEKVLATGEDGAEGGTWACERMEAIRGPVMDADYRLSRKGYKTLGVAMSVEGGTMRFLGIIPMLDPPRADTKPTLRQLQELGVRIKMITGDHTNIAKETARVCGLGSSSGGAATIMPRRRLGMPSVARDQLIEAADGFAQVLPVDKQDIVAVLQRQGHVVGMTGDGVNDAPALSQAQIGIAVHGATDAVCAAADILLTEPGLSPLVTAVVESRRIFRRLQTFITYRMAATIQIVAFLSLLVFAFDESLPAIYVILLALFNDATAVLCCYDRARPSPAPRRPSLLFLVPTSGTLGLLLTVQSLLFYAVLGAHPEWGLVSRRFRTEAPYRQTLTYAQISLAISGLVMVVRADGPFFLSRPGTGILLSTLSAVVVVTLICGLGIIVPRVGWRDLGVVWAYDALFLFLLDATKLLIFHYVSPHTPTVAWTGIGVEGTGSVLRPIEPIQGLGGVVQMKRKVTAAWADEHDEAAGAGGDASL